MSSYVSRTFNVIPYFQPGYTVSAYAQSNWPGDIPPSGSPRGTAVSAGTVSSTGTLTLTLPTGASYYLASNGSGSYVYIRAGGTESPVSTTPKVRTLHVFGDSYVNGVGATLGTSDFGTVLGHMLGVTNLTVDGVNGAQAAADGIHHILQTFNPARTAKPYLPATQVMVLKYGTNDIANSVAVATYKKSIRSMVARARYARIIEDTDAAWAGLGGSSPTANFNCNSGAGASFTFGGPVTFTVPSDFEGGTIGIHTLAGDGADATTQITWQVDGGTGIVQNGYTDHRATLFNNHVQRFTGLSAGAHTITATVGGTNSVYFDFVGIEANPLPLVVLPTTPVLPGGASAATVATYNQALVDVAAEFGDHVIVVDFQSIFTNHTDWLYTDNTHPNERGHRLGYANTLFQSIMGSAWSSTDAASAA